MQSSKLSISVLLNIPIVHNYYSLADVIRKPPSSPVLSCYYSTAPIKPDVSLSDRFKALSESLEKCNQSLSTLQTPASYEKICEFISQLSDLTEVGDS